MVTVIGQVYIDFPWWVFSHRCFCSDRKKNPFCGTFLQLDLDPNCTCSSHVITSPKVLVLRDTVLGDAWKTSIRTWEGSTKVQPQRNNHLFLHGGWWRRWGHWAKQKKKKRKDLNNPVSRKITNHLPRGSYTLITIDSAASEVCDFRTPQQVKASNICLTVPVNQ